jgi:hypothetical protein
VRDCQDGPPPGRPARPSASGASGRTANAWKRRRCPWATSTRAAAPPRCPPASGAPWPGCGRGARAASPTTWTTTGAGGTAPAPQKRPQPRRGFSLSIARRFNAGNDVPPRTFRAGASLTRRE